MSKEFEKIESFKNGEVGKYGKGIALKCTKEFGKDCKDVFTSMKGRYNPSLSFGPGWVFPSESKDALISFLKGNNASYKINLLIEKLQELIHSDDVVSETIAENDKFKRVIIYGDKRLIEEEEGKTLCIFSDAHYKCLIKEVAKCEEEIDLFS